MRIAAWKQHNKDLLTTHGETTERSARGHDTPPAGAGAQVQRVELRIRGCREHSVPQHYWRMFGADVAACVLLGLPDFRMGGQIHCPQCVPVHVIEDCKITGEYGLGLKSALL